MKKILILSLLCLFMTSFISAEVETLGTFKQNSCVNLVQTCDNCTYVTLTKIQVPNSNIITKYKNMTQSGSDFSINDCNTSQIGNYIATTCGDVDGTYTCASYDYEITPSGFDGTIGFYYIVILLAIGSIILGFTVKDGWFVVFGGIGFLLIGLYSINYGIIGIRDMFITWAISLSMIGAGAYLAIRSTLEIINENLE